MEFTAVNQGLIAQSKESRSLKLIFIVVWKMSAPQLKHVHSRSRYGAHANADFYFDIESSKYNTKYV